MYKPRRICHSDLPISQTVASSPTFPSLTLENADGHYVDLEGVPYVTMATGQLLVSVYFLYDSHLWVHTARTKIAVSPRNATEQRD